MSDKVSISIKSNVQVAPVDFTIVENGGGYLIKSDRKVVMDLIQDKPSSLIWFVYPYFGGSFTVEAPTLNEAIAEAMNFFKCFITAPYTFRKL